jgi:hypothetical protein
MDKKELPKEEKIDFSKLDPGLAADGKIKTKLRKFIDRTLDIIKLLIGLCLLIFVYTGSRTFIQEFNLVEKNLQSYFWWGIASFVISYLFIYQFGRFYQKGQKILTAIFKFFSPLVKVAPYLLPVYTIIIFCLYPLFNLIFNSEKVTGYFLFFAGFSLALHLVFSARLLRLRQGDFLKSNYIFSFSFIYLVNLILVSFILSLILAKFSFIEFFNASFQGARDILDAVLKQIFVVK